MKPKIKFLKGIILIEVVLLILLLFVCLNCTSDIADPKLSIITDETVAIPIDCNYQSLAHCFLNYDSTKVDWRYSGFECDYWNLNPANISVSRSLVVDYLILEEVPFRMTINYEVREIGSSVPGKVGCQTICPESRIIIVPKGGIEGRYETIVHAFCGRVVLYNGLAE